MMNRGIREKLRNIKNAAAEAVFPSNIYCISCGSMIDGTRPYSLCDKCVRKLHWTGERVCEKCGKALPDAYRGRLCYDCMIYSHSFEKGYSCLTYGLYERELLLELKYNGKGYLADKMGDILYDRISCENVQADVIIPVPVGRKRMKKRGYNQSALMAKRLSERWKVPMEAAALCREKETPLLRSLAPAQREEALDGAFSVTGSGCEKISGKRVLLVDDIYTTGATADACSRALLEAGASAVLLLVLASGGNRKPNME